MFAARMKQFEGSGIRKMFELAATMKNPIDLSLGQADFDAPEAVKQGAIDAITMGKNRYSVTAGVPELCDAIRTSLAREQIHPESVMSVAGACGGLLLSLLVLADESTEVLIQDPYFVAYIPLIKLTGARVKLIDTYPDFRITPERLRTAASPQSKVLLFNTPSNPTGIAYTPSEIKALVETAQDLGLTVISDEVYDRFCYDFPHTSWAQFDPATILIRSLSKTGGVPGWRVGYVAGPDAILEKMKILQQFTFVCVNTPAQWGTIAALEVDLSSQMSRYRKKRDVAFEGLSKAFKVEKPSGAFYLFPEIPQGKSEEFLKRCIEKEVLIVPGSAFSSRNTHFRVSYALPDESLVKGIELLCEAGEGL